MKGYNHVVPFKKKSTGEKNKPNNALYVLNEQERILVNGNPPNGKLLEEKAPYSSIKQIDTSEKFTVIDIG